MGFFCYVLDLLVLVDVHRRRAASGQHDQDGQQHGASRPWPARWSSSCARRSSSTRSARSFMIAANGGGDGSDRSAVLLADRGIDREHDHRDRAVRRLHPVLAADLLHLVHPADAHAVRICVRRHSAQGRHARLSANGSPYVAVLLALVASFITLIWAVNGSSFFQVLVYATLVQLIAMALVGLAAVLVPYTKPDLYRASATQEDVRRHPRGVDRGRRRDPRPACSSGCCTSTTRRSSS